MQKTDFDEFVKRQQVSPKSEEPVDWNKQRDEWIAYLESLYEEIEGYLADYVSSGQARSEYRPINLNEEYIGSYDAKEMVIRIGRQEVKFAPIGTLLVGAKGRVDVIGAAGKASLLLVKKSATSFRSLIKVSRVTAGAPAPVTQRPEPVEWAWKIGPTPPQITFAELTQESFFEMVSEVANG